MLDRVPQPFAISAQGASASSGTVVLSNSNGLSFGQNGNTVTGSYTVPTVPAQLSVGNSNLGNTAGNSGVVTGRLVLVGSQNITLSGSTNGGSMTISLSGGAAGGFSAGVSTGGNTQGNTGVTGSRLVFVGNPNITLSQATDANGATITFSGGAGAAGNTGFLSDNANTASLGTIRLSNANGVTFGLNGQTLTASVSQSNQTVGVYGSSQTTGSASSGTHDARSISIIGAGIVSVGNHSTSAGGTTTGVVISATQSNQAFSASGGSSAFQTLSFNNANGFTFSNVGGAVQGSYTVPTVTNSSWTVSDSVTSATVGRLAFTASNGITMTLSTSNNGNHTLIASYTVPTVTAGSDTAGMSNLGNTSGTSGVVSGDSIRILFAGGNNVTLSQSLDAGNRSATITISAANTIAQTNQSAIKAFGASNTGNTAGNTGVSTGIDWVLAATSGLTVSESTVGGGPNTLWLSVGSYITTADLSQNSSKYIQNWKLTGNTAGTTSSAQGTDFWLAGGNNITVSGSSNTISISAANQTVESQSIGMSNVGNTSGTTGMASGGQVRFVFAGGNNITLSQSLNGASGTITISAPNLGAGAFSGGASNLGNTAGATGLTGTQLVIVGSNNITLSQTTGANGGTLSIIGGAGGGFSAGVSTMGNTAGATGLTGTQLVLVGTNALTLSQTTDSAGATVTLSVPATSSLSATGFVSISTNANTISIGATHTLNVYAGSNTSGTSSGTCDPRTLSIHAAGMLTVAASDSGYELSAPNYYTLSEYEPYGVAAGSILTNSTLGQNTIYFAPFDVPHELNAYRLNLFVSVATGMSAANSTGRAGYTISAALYSRGTGASTERISSFWSCSAGISATQNSNTQLVVTNLAGISNSTAVSTVGSSLSTSNASTYMATSMGGYRVIPLPISSTLTPGRYWLGVANSSLSSNAGVVTLNCSVMQMTSGSNLIAFQQFGGNSSASNVSFRNAYPGLGSYSATSGAFPGTVALSANDIRAPLLSLTLPLFNISGYTTSPNIL